MCLFLYCVFCVGFVSPLGFAWVMDPDSVCRDASGLVSAVSFTLFPFSALWLALFTPPFSLSLSLQFTLFHCLSPPLCPPTFHLCLCIPSWTLLSHYIYLWCDCCLKPHWLLCYEGAHASSIAPNGTCCVLLLPPPPPTPTPPPLLLLLLLSRYVQVRRWYLN